MFVGVMSRMMESMAPSSVRGLTTERPGRSEGLAKSVYDQMRSEFFVAGPFVLHGEVPSLLAASWCLVRETLFTGEADRGEKEIIAWAVSQGNRCPFCIDAQGAAKAAAKSADPVIERWAQASTSAEAASTAQPPAGLTTYRAEYLGTMTAFHYLNRMVSVFLDKKMMPVPNALDGLSQPMAKFMMGGLIDKAASLEPGLSLGFVSDIKPSLAWRPAWAEGSPTVTGALEGWSATVEAEAANRFEPGLLKLLGERFDRWDGSRILAQTANDFADTAIAESSAALASLAILAAEAPCRVRKADVDAAVRASSSADALAMVAWAAQRAARRCVNWAT